MVESNLIETFLYKSEDGPVSIKVIIDQETKHYGQHKKQWLIYLIKHQKTLVNI